MAHQFWHKEAISPNADFNARARERMVPKFNGDDRRISISRNNLSPLSHSAFTIRCRVIIQEFPLWHVKIMYSHPLR